MSQQADLRIDVEAVTALLQWKSIFAEEVATRGIAAESGQPDCVTLWHYREAAQIAIRSLSTAILDGGVSSGDEKAA